ncbi:MAG TPA: hypothetical protein GXZ43_03870 [Clostridiaceae bacterium]|nr:hypothetical protein [Clostridiaceae bacterium]
MGFSSAGGLFTPRHWTSKNAVPNKDVQGNEALFKLGIIPLATVEAEYGNYVLEGSYVTLAHHVSGWSHNPIPCITEINPIRYYCKSL